MEFDRSDEEIEAERLQRERLADQYLQNATRAAERMKKGDLNGAVDSYCDGADCFLEGVGLGYVPGEPTRPYQKRGAADATAKAVSVAKAVLDPKRDKIPVSLTVLSAQGQFLARADRMAGYVESVGRILAVVANPVYDEARGGVVTLMRLMEPKIGASPSLQRDVAVVNEFLEGRFERAGATRALGRAADKKASREAEQKEKAAAAREEGRGEAMDRLRAVLGEPEKK